MRTLLLLCLLVLGPLQAQAAYACAMMDTVVHDDCCCEDSASKPDGLRAERGTGTEDNRTPCCEVSVEITVDQETRQYTPVFKPPDQRPDFDLPPALVTTFDRPFLWSQRPTSYAHNFVRRLPRDGGSDTWLLTRRLRI